MSNIKDYENFFKKNAHIRFNYQVDTYSNNLLLI